MTEITERLHKLAMPELANLIRFLISTDHPYLALCAICILGLGVTIRGLRHLPPFRFNLGLDVGPRQEPQQHDKTK